VLTVDGLLVLTVGGLLVLTVDGLLVLTVDGLLVLTAPLIKHACTPTTIHKPKAFQSPSMLLADCAVACASVHVVYCRS
jgi:hypothetical protein